MMRKIFVALLLANMGMMASAQSLSPAWNTMPHKNMAFSNRTTAYLSPVRVVWHETVDDASIAGVDNLLLEGNGQAELVNSDMCVMRTGKHGRASLLLDFGKELHGGLQFVTGMSSHKEIDIRIRFGESVSEAMSEMRHGTTNDHAIRDFNLKLPWLGVSETAKSGFRFVRIDLEGEDIELKLKEVRAVFEYRDIPYLGSFKSDDERLNEIWMTGAYTVHLNMQEYLWDGIKRDRLVWVGDLHPEVMTINSVFGYNEVVPKSLDLIRDITPIPNWMNGISSYSIWWLIIHRDWYYYHGDIEYLSEQRDYIFALLEHLMSKVGDNGKEMLDGNRFLDWPSSENQKGIDAGLQSLMLMAMNAGEGLAMALDDKSMAKKCRKTADRLMSYAPEHNGLKQAAALMALSGLMDAEDAVEDVVAVDGAKDFSTFYGYYMLEAMALAGEYQTAIDVINEYWGAMLDLGATTFWEDFDMEWMDNAARIDEIVPEGKTDVHATYGDYCYKSFRHSLCHGWASGPTAWMSKHVLGIQILEPGCKKIKIEPHLGDLKWVEGTFPTPYGLIKVRHEVGDDGNVYSEIQVPENVKVVE